MKEVFAIVVPYSDPADREEATERAREKCVALGLNSDSLKITCVYHGFEELFVLVGTVFKD